MRAYALTSWTVLSVVCTAATADIGTVTLDIKAEGRDSLRFVVGYVPATISVELYASATTAGSDGPNNGVQALYADVVGSALAGVMQSAFSLLGIFTNPYQPPAAVNLGFDLLTSPGYPDVGEIVSIGASQSFPPGPGSDDMPGAMTASAPGVVGRPPVLFAAGTVVLDQVPMKAATGGYQLEAGGGANFWKTDGTSVPAAVIGDTLTVTIIQPAVGDLDFDADVDINDFLTFSICFNGSLRPLRPSCENAEADMDGDGDVDGHDFLTFATCYNGSDRPSRCP